MWSMQTCNKLLTVLCYHAYVCMGVKMKLHIIEQYHKCRNHQGVLILAIYMYHLGPRVCGVLIFKCPS